MLTLIKSYESPDEEENIYEYKGYTLKNCLYITESNTYDHTYVYKDDKEIFRETGYNSLEKAIEQIDGVIK